MRILVFNLIFHLCIYRAFPQTLVEGMLVDKSNAPIPFATVGIINKSIGTITELDGSFSLNLAESLSADTVTFSAIGYEKKMFGVAELIRSNRIKVILNESITELDEVTISTSHSDLPRSQLKIKGNLSHNTGTMRLDKENNGGAMALLIKCENAPIFVTKAQLMIRHNSLESFKVRLRFMGIDSISGKPTGDLINKNLVYESSIKRGWLKLDLSTEEIWLNQNSFFLVFEWIMDSNTRNELESQLIRYVDESPESISKNNLFVAGEQVSERMVKDFTSGVWFGTLIDKSPTNDHVCYYRLNSGQDWRISAAILSAHVKISEFKHNHQ